MTNKTNMASLREELLTKGKRNLTATEVVTIISEMDKLNDVVKHLRIEVSASDAAFLEMKKQYSTQLDRCRELTGQLEAARQRAERGEAAAGIIQQAYAILERSLRHTEETLVASNDLLSAAEKEIAALKTDIESYISINGELATEVEVLKDERVPR